MLQGIFHLLCTGIVTVRHLSTHTTAALGSAQAHPSSLKKIAFTVEECVRAWLVYSVPPFFFFHFYTLLQTFTLFHTLRTLPKFFSFSLSNVFSLIPVALGLRVESLSPNELTYTSLWVPIRSLLLPFVFLPLLLSCQCPCETRHSAGAPWVLSHPNASTETCLSDWGVGSHPLLGKWMRPSTWASLQML